MRHGFGEDNPRIAEKVVPVLEFSHPNTKISEVHLCDGIGEIGYREPETFDDDRSVSRDSFLSDVPVAESVLSGKSGSSFQRYGSTAHLPKHHPSRLSEHPSRYTQQTHRSPHHNDPLLEGGGAGAPGSLPLPPWLVGPHRGLDLLHTTLPNRSHVGVGVVASAQCRQRLIAFYRCYNPDKLDQVTSMLIQYKGREEYLFDLLAEKYGPEPHELDDSLPYGWTKVISPKGEAFYRHEDGRRQWEPPDGDGAMTEQSEILPPAPGTRPDKSRRKGRTSSYRSGN